MTTNQHPITPPPELVRQWHDAWIDAKVKHDGLIDFLAAQAAQWGADQELEACCKWTRRKVTTFVAHAHLEAQRHSDELRAARRPKPPSLKEQALHILDTHGDLTRAEADTIRRALKAL